jgi:predicted TIM-barrel fold metal-dependent hydrolase
MRKKSANQQTPKFYDIHFHAFNLSHAGLVAILNRLMLNQWLNLGDLAEGKILKIIFSSSLLLKGTGILILLLFLVIWLPDVFLGHLTRQSPLLSSLIKVLIFGILVLIPLVSGVFKPKRIINLLTLIDGNIGRQLRYLELDLVAMDPGNKDMVKRVKKNFKNKWEIEKIQQEWNGRKEHEKVFHVNRNAYKKMVLTPLMVDFEFNELQSLKNKIPYDLPPLKPVLYQLIDLVNGIIEYRRTTIFNLLEIRPFMALHTKNYNLGAVVKVSFDITKINVPKELKSKVFIPPKEWQDRFAGKSNGKDKYGIIALRQMNEKEVEKLIPRGKEFQQHKRVIMKQLNELFPDGCFPRENTIPKMLAKYFGDLEEYSKKNETCDLNPQWSTILLGDSTKDTGGVEPGVITLDRLSDIPEGFFSGIKVYPPLGFNPWPDENKEPVEAEKVKYLYKFCVEKNIPITTHCSNISWQVIERKKAEKYTNPKTWEKVLQQEEYKTLKLNFAHFGSQRKSLWFGRKSRSWEWLETILNLMLKYDHVYADFSYEVVFKNYCSKLFKRIKTFGDEHAQGQLNGAVNRLYDRILFGSDFLINLIEIDSYKKYLEIFRDAPFPPDVDREKFCAVNPVRFLFP